MSGPARQMGSGQEGRIEADKVGEIIEARCACTVHCKDFGICLDWNKEPLGILRRGVTGCGSVIEGSLLQLY